MPGVADVGAEEDVECAGVVDIVIGGLGMTRTCSGGAEGLVSHEEVDPCWAFCASFTCCRMAAFTAAFSLPRSGGGQ